MSKKPLILSTPENHLIVFQEKAIRRTWHQDEWWFSIVDVCGVLTDSRDAGAYWRKLKQRLAAEGSEVVTFCHGLKLEAPDGKQRLTDCANTEGLFRIIQSIPSPKAEPFKRWLAQVGYERVKEIENPELASARARALYQAKGYPQAWIEKRLRSIAVRGELTDEWKARGVEEGKEYAILTAEITRATFGVTLLTALGITLGGWTVMQMVSRLLRAPATWLGSKLWTLATGRPTMVTARDILAGTPLIPVEAEVMRP